MLERDHLLHLRITAIFEFRQQPSRRQEAIVGVADASDLEMIPESRSQFLAGVAGCRGCVALLRNGFGDHVENST